MIEFGVEELDWSSQSPDHDLTASQACLEVTIASIIKHMAYNQIKTNKQYICMYVCIYIYLTTHCTI